MQLDLRKALCRRACLTAVLVVAAAAAGASQTRWNEKTILKFSEPVMVPGATLQPGTYVFKLMNSNVNRHLVQISTENGGKGGKVVALAQAVPMKRLDPKGDVVLRFSPTATGSPPAIKGWFYPGSVYGHEFVYTDRQAKDIAQRTKTVVLSIDVPGSDLERGTLRVYNAEGIYGDWRGDPATMTEWREWASKRATAPAIETGLHGTRVNVGTLEEQPAKYVGQTVSVDAEIDRVYGPRLFTIDEPDWGDLEGEILVHLAPSHVAPVRENDRVTITGTIKRYVSVDVDREWGWSGLDRQVEADLAKRPVLVATRVVGGNSDLAMLIDTTDTTSDTKGGTPTGTAETVTKAPIKDVATLINADERQVGRAVDLSGVKVERMAKSGGFFTTRQNETLFILPARSNMASLALGDVVALDGIILQMPRDAGDRLPVPSGQSLNDDIYVFAKKVAKTGASN